MNGVHDMGGMHGFGPVRREEGSSPFHAPWEGRVFAMMTALTRGRHTFNLDEMRRAVESIQPAQYLASVYYALRLAALRILLVEKGVVTASEIDAMLHKLGREPERVRTPARRDDPALAAAILADIERPPKQPREAIAPRFRPGDREEATFMRDHGGGGGHGAEHRHEAEHHHETEHHHGGEVSQTQLLTAALESLLVEKGLLSSDTIDQLVERYEKDIGPMIGARVVARAWTDPAYKQRLLSDSASALAELGIHMDNLVVVENTPAVHNAVVCTLCSCYPWAVLGLPPTWYKEPAYRSRMVIEPRAVLREFGLELDGTVEVRVWDSSAEQRYLVLPERPAGTEGMTEAELATLVSRDSMIGVARVAAPARAR